MIQEGTTNSLDVILRRSTLASPTFFGLEAIRYWIRKRRDLIDTRFSEDFILESIELMLKNNNFYFDNEMYRQLIGTAMGHVFAPQYACLVIGYLEEVKLFPVILPRFFSEDEIKVIKEFYSRYMDDGFTLLPASVDPKVFLQCLNSLDPSIRFTLEPAAVSERDGMKVQILNFLDLTIILFENGTIQTDIYYKPTNSHHYLDYNSFHPLHIKNNIPYGLTKRILSFVTDPAMMEFRLEQLRSWLRRCNYPNHVIEKGIFNARLQGPAQEPIAKDNVIPFITTFSSNLNTKEVTRNIQTLITNRQHGRLKEILTDLRVVAAYRQPPNLRHLLCKAKYGEESQDTLSSQSNQLPPGLFANCSDPRCNLCSLGYIQQCTSFVCANGKTWEIRIHINCNSRNVIYFLVCNMCNIESNTGKTWQKFRGRLNDHITKCRTGNGTNKFDKHVHECGKKHGNLKAPYFKVYAFMKLSSRDLLISYENYFHRNGYDSMNCPS